jgi:hypothetical protein
MFAIKVADNYLDLTGVSLRWETVNEVFSDKSFQGDWSFPFDLPFTPANLKTLGFINKPDVPNKKLQLTCTVFFGGDSYNALLIVNGSKNTFSCNIAGGVKGLINADKKLSELNFKSITTGLDYIDLGASFGNLASYQYVNWQLAAAFPPYYNPGFYGGSNPTFNGVVNRMDATTGAYKQNTTMLGNKYCISPWLYAFFILKTIFDENGLAMDGSFISDTEASSLLIYSNYALDQNLDSKTKVKLPINTTYGPGNTGVIDPVPFQNNINNASDPSGAWNNSSKKFKPLIAGDYAVKFFYKIFCPNGAFLNIHILKNGAAVAGTLPGVVVPAGVWVEYTYVAALPSCTTSDEIWGISAHTIGNQVISISDDSYFEIYKYDDGEYNKMDTIMYFKNHVPDLTVAQFIKSLKNFARIKTDFDWQNKIARMDYIADVMDEKASVDLTPFASPNYEQVFDDAQKGFICKYDFGNDDLAQSYLLPKIDESKIIGEYPTPDDLPIPSFVGDLAIVLNSNQVYRCQVGGGGFEWSFYTHYYFPIEYGNKEKEQTIELAPMLMDADQVNESATSDPDHIICLMPAINERGSSPMFDLGINAPSLRCAFMRGRNIDYTGVGGRYIYASPTNIDLNGNVVGAYNLKLQGNQSWYELKHQKFLEAMDGGELYEFLINIPLNYLKHKGKVQIKNVNYLVKNISTGITITTVKQSLYKLLKL